MIHYNDIDRTKSLQRLAPSLFTEEHKSVLYIGARNGGFEYGINFRIAKTKITMLEAFEENVNFLKQIPWITNVIHGDVRYKEIEEKFDIIFWWHGPEHVSEVELPIVVKKLESICNNMVVMGCPWGIYEQNNNPYGSYNNPYEVHVSHFDYPIFENMGYTVECLGKKDVPGSNITSIKGL